MQDYFNQFVHFGTLLGHLPENVVKMKKNLQAFVFVMIVFIGAAEAKNPCGIYKTCSDFKNNQLCMSDSQSKKSTVRVHEFFWNMPTISIICGGRKEIYRKNELFGFRDCNGDAYRFYKNLEYRIADTGKIYVYTRQENVAQGKVYKLVNTYYFSTAPDGEIIPLNIANLKNAFSSNRQFLDLLDQYCGSGNVTGDDAQHKMYKVNDLYTQAMVPGNK